MGNLLAFDIAKSKDVAFCLLDIDSEKIVEQGILFNAGLSDIKNFILDRKSQTDIDIVVWESPFLGRNVKSMVALVEVSGVLKYICDDCNVAYDTVQPTQWQRAYLGKIKKYGSEYSWKKHKYEIFSRYAQGYIDGDLKERRELTEDEVAAILIAKDFVRKYKTKLRVSR